MGSLLLPKGLTNPACWVTCLQAQTAKDVAPKPKSSGDKPLHDVVAGALARAISQATIHPIDTLKVRMQAGAKAATSGEARPPPSSHGLAKSGCGVGSLGARRK